MDFADKVVLITGGTGSFGKECARQLLNHHNPRKLIIFSRDELKQYVMSSEEFPLSRPPNLRYFIGDIRDKDRLRMALRGVDIVIHTAALKQVPAAEYNPSEYVKTNVFGSQNLIEAALESSVSKILALSTDKACAPINLYGATKLCADKLFIAANSYAGEAGCRFSIVRYGNVVGSRGSVIPLFLEMREAGAVTITHEEMTRFFISIRNAVKFTLECLDRMQGGEIFIPKIPSAKIIDMARVIAPECEVKIIGIRPGEKLHEMLIGPDDARYTWENGDHYTIEPTFTYWSRPPRVTGRKMSYGDVFASNVNNRWLTEEEIQKMVEECSR